jgi:parvulin-like peptidyl-prolyl isomerase
LLVFQLVSTTPAKVLGFDEVKETIIKRLQAQKESEFAKRIIERLRDEAKIQFNIPDPTKELAGKATAPAPAPAPAPANH